MGDKLGMARSGEVKLVDRIIDESKLRCRLGLSVRKRTDWRAGENDG